MNEYRVLVKVYDHLQDVKVIKLLRIKANSVDTICDNIPLRVGINDPVIGFTGEELISVFVIDDNDKDCEVFDVYE